MEATVFKIGLYASLAICAVGLMVRAVSWFRLRIGPDTAGVGSGARVAAALAGLARSLFGRKLLALLSGLLLDVVLQRRLLRADWLRWLGHISILTGFCGLLLFHALQGLITAKLVDGYQSTLDPFHLLRDALGAAVVLGLALLVLRKRRARREKTSLASSAPGDRLFVVLLALALLSGFALQATKISSQARFFEMTEEYMGSTDTSDTDEMLPLMVLWQKEYGVAFTPWPAAARAEMLASGRTADEEYCQECHSRPGAAFVSYNLARAMAPLAEPLTRYRGDRWLYWLHIMACFLGLAYLPFSRFVHLVTDPQSLLVNSVADEPLSAANRATRRALSLDACIRCGICDAHCSVEPGFRLVSNRQILPSRRLRAVRSLEARRHPAPVELRAMADGAHFCTLCGRCTERCPAGIDLQDLWGATLAELTARGHASASVWIKEGGSASQWADRSERAGVPVAWEKEEDPVVSTSLTGDLRTFSSCVQCQTCTNVCPVVAASDDPEQGVDLTPQKVMNLLRLGLRDMALGSRMVWDCATCYQCQENCPEDIRVADILYELRNMAHHRFRLLDGDHQAKRSDKETGRGRRGGEDGP